LQDYLAGLFGYFLGGIFEFVAYKFFGNGYWLTRFAVIGFAGFGLFAPSRSRDLWSAFWTELLGLLSTRK